MRAQLARVGYAPYLTWGTGPIVARPGHLLCNISHCGIILGTELGLL
jgi:hypothetical protein